MSRVRNLGAAALVVGLLVVSASACSSGEDKTASTTSRPNMVFKTGLAKVNDLGVCRSYKVADMKAIVGGGTSFRILAPTAIGKKGDTVIGQTCSWEQRPGGDKARSLTVEVRKWSDPAGLQAGYDKLRKQTVGAKDMASLGDGAFSAVGPTTTLLQVRSGNYFMTFSSVGQGGLEPVPLDALENLARLGLRKVA